MASFSIKLSQPENEPKHNDMPRRRSPLEEFQMLREIKNSWRKALRQCEGSYRTPQGGSDPNPRIGAARRADHG